VEVILKKINYNEELITKTKIASFMHDIGYLQGKKEHNTLVLILADKLDIKKTRVTEAGKNIKNETTFIYLWYKNKYKGKKLNHNFITNKKINIKELNEFYFTKKYLNLLNHLQQN